MFAVARTPTLRATDGRPEENTMRAKSIKAVTVFQLLALAYLGFYAWGLAMSVFTPVELGALSVLAAGLVVGLVVSALIARAARTPASDEAEERRNAQLRERRGF
jgi:TRAP-type C4-dicarboxylate transport system permease large subunit